MSDINEQILACAADYKIINGTGPYGSGDPRCGDGIFGKSIEKKYSKEVREAANKMIRRPSPAKVPTVSDSEKEKDALIACYRQLWSRIPEEQRRNEENALVNWAEERYRVPWLKEHKEREQSDDWRPNLGDLFKR